MRPKPVVLSRLAKTFAVTVHARREFAHMKSKSLQAAACAFLFAAPSTTFAQQTLPTIDVGGAHTRAVVAPARAPRASVAAPLATSVASTSATKLQPPNAKLQLDIQSATASRLGLTARQTPSSIVIIDHATIQSRNDQTTQEIIIGAPGVVAAAPPGSPGSVTMRGFTEGSVTQLFNGISVQYDLVAARPIDSWLIDRVEVLGGPASYLWGQGAVGGAINYISKVAKREDSRQELLASGGMFFNRRLSYGYNGRLGKTDNWLQIAGSYRGSNGFVERTPFVSGAGSASLLSDLTPQLTNLVAIEYQAENRDGYFGAPLLNPAFAGNIIPWGAPGLPSLTGRIDPRTRFKNYNSYNPIYDQRVFWARDIMDYRASDDVQLKNTLYFYRADRQWNNVETARWNAFNTLIDRSGSFAVRHGQTLLGDRLEASRSDRFLEMPMKTVGGLDVSWNTQVRDPSLEPFSDPVAPSVGNPVWPYSFLVGRYQDNPGATGPIGGARNRLRTIALFAENRLSLTSQLHLVTGLRWEDIEFSRVNLRLPRAPGETDPFGDPAFFKKSFQPLTWRAALNYDLSERANVYVTYSTAADPPAANLLESSAGSDLNFNLTTGRQIEGGAKFDFLDNRASATIAGYFIERKNLSTPDPNNPNRLVPVGAQSSNGVEVNVGAQLTPELSVQGNAAWVNPKFERFVESVAGLPISRAGNRPTNVPRWVANGWLTWKFLPEWELLLAGRYVGDRFADNGNSIRARDYTTFDALLTWKIAPQAKLTASVRNIADTVYTEWATATPYFILGAPRTFEMALRVSF